MNVHPRVTLARQCLGYLTKTNQTSPLKQVDVVMGFGRYSVELNAKVAELLLRLRPKWFAISGNEGKNSGPLAGWGIAEAHCVISAALQLMGGCMPVRTKVLVDLKATNGAENAANMVAMLIAAGLGDNPLRIAAVMHSTQRLRLGLTLLKALANAGIAVGAIEFVPSGYKPDVWRSLDQWEILFEISALADRADEGILDLPEDFPHELLPQVREELDLLTVELRQELGDAPISTAGLPSA